MRFLCTFSVLFVFFLSFPSCVIAQYIATGPFKVTSCKGFVIKVCEIVTIDAVEQDGKMYSMKKKWDEVDSYSNGTCHLNLTGKGIIPFLHKALNPSFYHYDKSKNLRKIKNIEGQVTFPCKKPTF